MTDERILFFDTETNGKRVKKPRGSPSDWQPPLSQEPAIIQIAAKLFWGRRSVASLNFFIHPINYDGSPATIPTEQFFLDNGLTQATIDAIAVPYKVGLAAFNNLVKVSDKLVAHNMQFDDPVIRSGYSRIAAPQRAYWDTPKSCTMKTLEPVLKLPGKYGYKFPTLDESYRALVDPMGFEGAHDAMVDVDACAAVFWKILDEGYDVWQLPESWPKEPE